jgi:hypothetical protein
MEVTTVLIDDESVADHTRHAQERDTVPPPSARRRVTIVLRHRAVPLCVAVAMLVVGMTFEFLWGPVVFHMSGWFNQGDMWGMFRAAHFVGWGYLGGVYSPENTVVTYPGMAILLAPVAMLSGALHLSESFPPMVVAHPTAVFLVLPYEIILASTVLFAADALAEQLGVGSRRRLALCLLIGILVWPVVLVWGHAEDALTMTLALLGLRCVMQVRWTRAGWLFGFAIVVQPLVALAVPVLLAASPRGQRVLFAVRCAALTALTVGVAFLGNPSGSYLMLIKQPTPVTPNHATPWVSLAPNVGTAAPISGGLTKGVNGHFGKIIGATGNSAVSIVAGGPGRMIYVLVAVLAGLYVWRRPQDTVRLLWLVAAVLATRCFFEAVMTPYYLAPPLLLLLVLAARRGGRRFWTSAAIAVSVSVFAYHHMGAWAWWLPIVAAMATIMALAFPSVPRIDNSTDDRRVDVPSVSTAVGRAIPMTTQAV